jgi:hypothetical protein
MRLLGGGAHTMEPFQAQGAAQAIQDAAMLGDALAGATSPEPEFPDALDRYAHRRLSITTSVQAGSARASEDHHLLDGPEAQARDAHMAAHAAVRSLTQVARPTVADPTRRLPTSRSCSLVPCRYGTERQPHARARPPPGLRVRSHALRAPVARWSAIAEGDREGACRRGDAEARPEVTSRNSTPPCRSWPAAPRAYGFLTSGRRREGTTHSPP